MILVFAIFIICLLLTGMPVAFALIAAGITGMLLFLGGPAAFTQIPVIAYKTLDDFVLVAVPLYILMSEILLKGKVGNGLFELGSKWLGHLPGGIGGAAHLGYREEGEPAAGQANQDVHVLLPVGVGNVVDSRTDPAEAVVL